MENKKKRHEIHLVSWDILSLLKKIGQWGIINIFIFGKDLDIKFLWRVLMGNGLWSEVIQAMYLKKKYVTQWIRDPLKNSLNV